MPRFHPLLPAATLFAALMLAVPLLAAQELPPAPAPARDPLDLARRFLGYTGETPVPLLGETYMTGDTATFLVPKRDGLTPVQVTATLAAENSTLDSELPGVYLWVEDGIDFDPAGMPEFAQSLVGAMVAYTLRETFSPFAYGLNPATPSAGSGIVALGDTLRVPDVDNDPHVFVLYTTDLAETRDGFTNPNDSLSPLVAPAGFSNGHEMIYINTTSYPSAALTEPVYGNAVVSAYFDLIMNANFPTTPWLSQALGLGLSLRQSGVTVASAQAAEFLAAPETSLLAVPNFANRLAVQGAQQLFLAYLEQRFGRESFYQLFGQPGDGITPVNETLAAIDAYDPVAGVSVDADALFADFALTNLLNFRFGDGRYVYAGGSVQGIASASEIGDLADAPVVVEGKPEVPQYGTRYYFHNTAEEESVRVEFTGAAHTPRLDMPASTAADDAFYYAEAAPDSDAMLTRAFDLADVTEATLDYDVWYDLASAWSYLYVAVSADDGATWTVLPPDGLALDNHNGVAYGAGYTGVSNPEAPQPFPILGIIIATDNATIADLSPGGAAAAAGVLPGDRMIGYDDILWQGTPDILAALTDYAPGDTFTLIVDRDGERLDLPIILAAHPTRTRPAHPLWLAQSVDLGAYVGQNILVRFELVTLPNEAGAGAALDNIRLDALDFTDDDAHADEWAAAGWQTITNRVPQRWLVQVVTTGVAATASADRIPPRVQTSLILDGDTAAPAFDETYALASGETLLVAVSALSDSTRQPASFELQSSRE